jgi:hypothetical protein
MTVRIIPIVVRAVRFSVGVIFVAIANYALGQTSPVDRDIASERELKARFIESATPNSLGEALLSRASRQNPKSFAWLLERGANCDHQNESGVTVLMMATYKLTELRDASSDATITKNFPGAVEVPWRWQSQIDSAEAQIFDLALACTSLLNVKNKDDMGAIHYAAQRQRFDAVLTMVRKGADVNLPGPGGETVIMSAPLKVFPDLVKIGANVNAVDSSGGTLLHHAFRIYTDTELLNFVKAATVLGARDTQDKIGKYASELDVKLPLAMFLGHSPQFFEHITQAREVVRATRR